MRKPKVFKGFQAQFNTVKPFPSSTIQNLKFSQKHYSQAFSQTKHYSQAFSLFDLSRLKVVIGFQAQKQYSQVSFFDLPKQMVFIGFHAQKQHSQAFSVFDLHN